MRETERGPRVTVHEQGRDADWRACVIRACQLPPVSSPLPRFGEFIERIAALFDNLGDRARVATVRSQTSAAIFHAPCLGVLN